MIDTIPTSEELNAVIADGFLDFCNSKGSEKYNYVSSRGCALYQFLSTKYSKLDSVGAYHIYFEVDFGCRVEFDKKYDSAVSSVTNFHDLAKRLEAAA